MIYHYAFIIHQKQRCVNTPFDFFLKKDKKVQKKSTKTEFQWGEGFFCYVLLFNKTLFETDRYFMDQMDHVDQMDDKLLSLKWLICTDTA